MIEVLHELSQPSSFDNYIDVMQQYIDLAHTIISKGATQPAAKFAGEGWTAEIDMLFHHLKAFTNNIKKLASQWMGVDYKTKYHVDFLEPLKSLTTDARIGYWTKGYNTPSELVPFFEDLKKRLVFMTENDNISSNQVEKAIKVWMVCKIMQDRAIFIANRLISMMEKNKPVVSINLREIIAHATPTAPGSFVNEFDEAVYTTPVQLNFLLEELRENTTDGGKRTRRHKRSGHKRSAHKKRSGKRSGHNKRSGHKRSVHKSRRR
jgi:hypothetical protein